MLPLEINNSYLIEVKSFNNSIYSSLSVSLGLYGMLGISLESRLGVISLLRKHCCVRGAVSKTQANKRSTTKWET